jgi:RNA polymerase sigma factor for flagellar operon FliA
VRTEIDRLLAEGMGVLQVVAKRIARRLGHRIPAEDLMAVGRPALIDIARTYDPTRSRFTKYARVKLTWAIIDGLRRETRWRSEHARAAALGASERYAEATAPAEELPPEPQEQCERQIGELLAGHAAAMVLGLTATPEDVGASLPDEGDSPEECAAAAELAADVRRAVQALPERERALIERHYYGGERFDLIAQDLGISKSRASRLHAHGIEQLSRALRDRSP